jgi:hypothetical protein
MEGKLDLALPECSYFNAEHVWRGSYKSDQASNSKLNDAGRPANERFICRVQSSPVSTDAEAE